MPGLSQEEHIRSRPNGVCQGGAQCMWVRKEGERLAASIPFVLLNFKYINYSNIKSIKKIRDFMNKIELRLDRIFRGWKESRKVLGVHLTVGRGRRTLDVKALRPNWQPLTSCDFVFSFVNWNGKSTYLISSLSYCTTSSYYCALTYIISFNLFEISINGWLREVKILVPGHTASKR